MDYNNYFNIKFICDLDNAITNSLEESLYNSKSFEDFETYYYNQVANLTTGINDLNSYFCIKSYSDILFCSFSTWC